MRLSRNYMAALLVSMGQLHTDSVSADIRKDAGETATFTRALEYVITETYKVEYPDLRARDFIPINSRVPSGAQSFVWRLWDWAGMAKIISNHADDLPTVEIMAAEKAQGIVSVGIGYTYSIQDIRSAQLAGVALETEKAAAARRGHENKIELLAAFGDAATGLPGFLNHTNVPILSAPGDIDGDWFNPALDPRSILADLHKIVSSVRTATLATHSPDTMLLPTSIYDYLTTLQLSQYSEVSVLQAFLRASPYVRNVDQWNLLDTADAAGTGPRIVVYEKNPRIVDLVIPQEFEQLPPQVKGLGFLVPCHSRIGGVCFKYPLAAVYVDDAIS